MSSHHWQLIKKTFYCWQEDRASMLSAALAYYTAFALAPLLVVCIAITGFFFGKDITTAHTLKQISDLVGTDSANQLATVITNISKPASSLMATTLGFIILLFGAIGLFSQLQEGLNIIWHVKDKPKQSWLKFLTVRVFSLVMILGVAFLLLVSLLLNTIIVALSHYINQYIPGAALGWLFFNLCISLGLITLLFAMIFKILPNILINWSDVWVGAFVTAVLFILGKFALEIYLSHSNIASAYGAAGSFLVILVWVYYSSQILFLGAEFTKVRTLAYRAANKKIKHAKPPNKSGKYPL